jgi:hypothetical protein
VCYRAIGSTTVNVVPSPTVLCTEMRPAGLPLKHFPARQNWQTIAGLGIIPPEANAMSTVIIEQAKVQLDLDQLIRAIQSLDAHERQQVREALDRDWAQDLESILREVRARYEAAPMTDDEIAAEVEAARVAYHARRR